MAETPGCLVSPGRGLSIYGWSIVDELNLYGFVPMLTQSRRHRPKTQRIYAMASFSKRISNLVNWDHRSATRSLLLLESDFRSKASVEATDLVSATRKLNVQGPTTEKYAIAEHPSF